MADTCAEIADRALAQPLYDAVAPYAAGVAALAPVLPLGSMARVSGRLATLLERWNDAEQHFEMALEHNAAMGFAAWVAWTELNYGEMLLRRGGADDCDRGVALLRQALAFASESGMAKVQRDSERLLSGIG